MSADPEPEAEATAEATGTPAGSTTLAGYRPADLVPPVGLGVLYLATVLGGLALTDEVREAGIVAFRDPQAVTNVGVFAVEVVVITAVIIAAQRLGVGMQLIRLFLLALFGMLAGHLVILAGHGTHVAGLPTSPAPVAAAVVVTAVLWVYPEWYVLDAAAVAGGAAIIPELGLSFGPLPIVVLLVAWAAYDAYAVYVSGHMKELAGGVGELRAPMMYVVPYTLEFSMLELDDLGLLPEEDDGGSATEDAEVGNDGPGDLPVTFLGLGDAIIPGMLAVSAGEFLPAPTVVPALNANLPALGALVGGVVGLAALLVISSKFEGVHAGLPPLNAGVLGGYLLGAVLADVPLTTALGI